MRAVFKKELSSFFHYPCGYAFAVLLLLLAAVPFIVYNLSITNQSVAEAISLTALFSAAIIPTVAVMSYPSKKRENTDRIYEMMPLSEWDVTAGKYLSSLALIMLPNITVLFYPMLAGMFSEVDHKLSYTAIFGYLLFEAALLAVCTFITKVSASRLRACIYCYAALLVWYLLPSAAFLIPPTPIASLICFAAIALVAGAIVFLLSKKPMLAAAVTLFICAVTGVAFLLLKSSFAGLFERVISSISAFAALAKFSRGIFDVGSVVFFATVIALFLFLTWRSHKKQYRVGAEPKGFCLRRVTSFSLALLAVASSVTVTLAAAAVPDRYFSLDATLSHKFSVSEKAEKFMQELDRDVTVYLLESTNNPEYCAYLDRLISKSPRVHLERVYHASTPEFYSDRGLSLDSISADSLVVQCGDRISYVSYYNLFFYSNETLGVDNMSYSQYQYYLSLFSSNEQYATYLEALATDTVIFFDADGVICSHIEYVAKDIIPVNYYLTGHGEKDINDSANAYAGLGLQALDISAEDVPADAASVFVNAPTSDIAEQERDRLLAYLERGGQVTFVTSTQNLSMPNLCAVLSAYGMSARAETVKQANEPAEGEEVAYLEEFTATVRTNNDILYYVDAESDFAPAVKGANAITVDESAVENLTVIPLLSSSNKAYTGENSDTLASYTLACAVEAPNRAKVAWFTGAEAFNKPRSDSVATVLYALSWVNLEYESELYDLPAKQYAASIATVDSFLADALMLLLILIPIAVGVCGVLILRKRKNAK